MATVTGYTAERMMEILNETIKSLQVVGNNLIATKYDNSTVNLGNVRGIQGIQGIQGEVTLAQLNAAILTSETNSGRGLVAFDEVTTHQSFFFSEGDWVDIAGCSITHQFTPGRYYEFKISGSLRSEEPGAVNNLSLGLRSTTTGSVLVRGTGFTNDVTWLTAINGSRIVKIPNDWTTPRSFKLSAYATTGYEVHIMSDTYPSQISVVDLGLLA